MMEMQGSGQMYQIPRLGLLWEASPFMAMEPHMGLEVVENMRRSSDGRSMEDVYRSMRGRLTRRGRQIVVGKGASAAAKGSLLQGLRTLFESDGHLQSLSEIRGCVLRQETVSFAQYTQVVKLNRTREESRELWIPPEVPQGGYTAEEYSRISAKMDLDIEEILASQKRNEWLTLLVESSATTSVPVARQLPMVVEGLDRGNSPGYELAARRDTHPSLDIFAIYKEHAVNLDASEWREAFNSGRELTSEDLQHLFSGNRYFFFTDKDGTRVNAADLPDNLKRQLAIYFKDCMAPPRAIERSDRDIMNLKQLLLESERVDDLSDSALFEHIRKVLKVSPTRFHHVTNTWFGGEKGTNLDYFFRSYPARKYPEILPVGIRRLVFDHVSETSD